MDYSNQDTLLEGLRKRDNAAYEHLHQTCFYAVFSIVKARKGNIEDAKDLYNEGVTILIQNIDREGFVLQCRVKTLLNTICSKRYGVSTRYIKSRQNYIENTFQDSYEESFDEEMDRSLYKNIFSTSFKKLKEECQEIIQKYLEEISTRRIAKEIGLSPESVRKRKSRCKKALISIIYSNPDYINLRKRNEI